MFSAAPKNIFFAFFLMPALLWAQEKPKDKKPNTAFYFSQDAMWNANDQVLTNYCARKGFFGINIMPPKRSFSIYVAAGLRLIRAQIFSPRFKPGFKNDYLAAYHAGDPAIESSRAGDALYQHFTQPDNKDWSLFGTNSSHAQLGLRLNSLPFQPSVTFVAYVEDFMFYGNFYEVVRGYEHDWLPFSSSAQELRLGLDVWGGKDHTSPAVLSVQVGYKWTRYNMQLGDIKLQDFTSQDFVDHYSRMQKLTFGLTFSMWFNDL